ncbi:MAG: acyltransferase family protein [Butyrivibrio sp.]|uniref:acyltransferase n=1 Tax=Butyrivibrio sp. TaxID=28121 RepID=UPI001B74F62E|nr:acyltransferase family protein [Butyrivibrio sp.]MBP3784906.1 acyltransferase family protein [Butyrivibrio sp.]
MEKKREYYLDIARVVSMFGVIMVHTGAISWYSAPFEIYPWGVLNIFDLLGRFSVPVFLMISGYLFLNPKREVRAFDIFTKYLPRLLCAYMFWSFLYAVITSGLFTSRSLSGGVLEKLLHDTVVGHYHMWYIFTIAGLYIITPAIRPIATDRKALGYFLLVSFVLTYVIPTLQLIPAVSEYTAPITSRFELRSISGYVFYYIAGYYFATQDLTIKTRKMIYAVGILSVLAMYFTVTTIIIRQQYPTLVYHDYSNAGMPLFGIAVFVFLRYRFQSVNPDTRIMRVVVRLSKMNLGIYLVHDFGLILFKKAGLSPVMGTPFIMVPLLAILDFAISAFVVYVVSHIPVLKKWII